MNEINNPAICCEDIGTAPDKSSIWRIMAGVFIEPEESFRMLATKPRWLVPLLIVIVTVFGQLLVTNEIRMNDLEKQIRDSSTLSAQEVQRRLGNIEAQRSPDWHWSGILNGLGFVSLAKVAQVLPIAFFLWLGLQFSQ